jgi:polyphosphate glucokinase
MLETPPSASVAAVGEVVRQLAVTLDADDSLHREPIGVTFPGVVQSGVIRTAANFAPEWIGCNATELFTELLGRPVTVLNDADAAGVAEMAFGGHDRLGVVIMLTLGTGIGSALFHDGVMLPNSELGHLELGGVDAEKLASARVRTIESLTWEQYAGRLERYLLLVEAVLWPRLIILGGGISRDASQFVPLMTAVRTPVIAATLGNDAGIVGAALACR